MKTKIFKILLTVLSLIIISLLFVIYLYNKPFIDVNNSKANLVVTAQELLNDYREDENLANKKYVDNIIEVKGEIAEISVVRGNSIITLKDANGLSSIICHMGPENNLNVLKLKKDNQITIKGICTGHLLDIIMVRCVLTNDKFNEE